MPFAIPFPNIGPEIFSVEAFGTTFALRWYAVSYIVAILVGWKLAAMTLRKPHVWANSTPVMTTQQLEEFVTWLIIGIVGGGRLGYVLFYAPETWARPIEVLYVWQGGMSFHGGMLGVGLAVLIFSRLRRIELAGMCDVMALGTPTGLLLGRLANFINAELWGRPTDLAWGVIFPGARAQDCPGVEGLCARHPSQLYEGLMEGVILWAVLFWLAWSRGALKRPGTITGVFLAGYGLARFLVEFVRQPDPQFISPGNPLGWAVHAGGLGLTMGQLLSLPMIALGAWLILRARRVPAPA
ncbi:MAG: prolipoprotein diacylglyceryl transferase [Rhodobacteraceae bacterium]|nr:prolipoprotein diacylglyceryl transferase [Paracoccaceae bacterium]